MKKIRSIEQNIRGLSAEETLQKLSQLDEERITFSTSFGYEDQVIAHMIFSGNLFIDVFTLDTGRLFPETYSVWNSTLERYGRGIKVFYPNTEAIQQLVLNKGPLSFYDSVDNRKECCFIRKVEPLKRALAGYTVWITGIRAEQSNNRTGMTRVEWDDVNRIIKIHPLLHWTFEEVKAYIKKYNIPYNPLHDKGFVSIGCQPCTRAIKEGDDFRAGRWWWEDASKKECGLHSTNEVHIKLQDNK
ncbi:MAG TPA: phosphoadenylyl-sulfate reductase [Bacteroidia bacterium]